MDTPHAARLDPLMEDPVSDSTTDVASDASQASIVVPGSIEHPIERHGGADEWAASIATGLSLTIVALVILAVMLDRRRPRPAALGLTRVLGLFALPLFLLPMGNFATLETSKRVEFCQSCHTAMDPYVTDMKDPSSSTLAAVHYTNRYIGEGECYQCHADYGVFGTAQAKLKGLQHMYHWVTRSETARGERQIALYQPYRNQLCLHCHAGSKRFLEAKDGVHLGMREDFFRHDQETGAVYVSCLDCHKPAHPTLADWKEKHAETSRHAEASR